LVVCWENERKEREREFLREGSQFSGTMGVRSAAD